jgi:hypothetical protein
MTPFTEEILNDKQIIEFVQNEEILKEDNTDDEEQLPLKVLPKEAFDAIKKVIYFIDNNLLIMDLK